MSSAFCDDGLIAANVLENPPRRGPRKSILSLREVPRLIWAEKQAKREAPAESTDCKWQVNIAKVLSALRIESLLKRCKVFQEMEDAVVKRVALMSEQATYPAGTVLFREGDPPGNCYMILSGQVGVFVMNPVIEVDEEQPSNETLSETAGSKCPSRRPSTEGRTHRRSRRPTSSNNDSVSVMPTVEGFSYYHAESDLGVQVATLQSGGILGEIAFMQEQLRTASIKCLADTEFVVVAKHAFENVLKAEMVRAREEKFEFLKDHLPGMRGVPAIMPHSRRPHPTFFFRRFSYARGHEFLTQGQIAEFCLFVVFKGSVEFRRTETSSSAHRTQRQERCSMQTRPCLLGRLSLEDTTFTKKLLHVGSLLRGGFFGSLPLTDLREPEPFTVVASTCVEVFSVPSCDISKLPRKLVDTVREYLMQAITSRLERLRSCRSIQTTPEKSSCAKSMDSTGTCNGLSRSSSMGSSLHLSLTPSRPESKHPSRRSWFGLKRACSQPLLGLSTPTASDRTNSRIAFPSAQEVFGSREQPRLQDRLGLVYDGLSTH